ncbi:FLYWCH zinc finger domain-containing protein [Phthorimaea operculella]|nr:FLYWCH zinc finger domain-containing protein [Phthorimaea operculella]
MENKAIFVRNIKGTRLAVLRGYTFSANNSSKRNIHWSCSQSKTRPWYCKVRIITTKDGHLVRMVDEHQHPPPQVLVRSGARVMKRPSSPMSPILNVGGTPLIVHKNTAGKELALISGHVFYKNSRNSWRCTRAKSCKARFLVDKQQNIKKANLVHNHDSNNYCIKNGIYMKLT